MSTEVLPANPKWLKWARTSVNYKDEVAKKLKIDPERITQWEETGEITFDNLIKLSRIYRVSHYTFF